MNETLLISDARYFFAKRNGRLIHIHTIRRWIAKGIRRNGLAVKLRSEREGNRLVTRPEWIQQFKQELSGNRTDPNEVTPRSISPVAAKRYLISEGLYGCTQKKLPRGGVRSPRRNSWALSQVLSGGATCDANERGDGRGVDSGQANQTEPHDSAE